MNQNAFLIFTGQLILAITLFAITIYAANTYRQIRFGQGTIHVKGCAEKLIHSDFVKWQGTMNVRDETLVQAYEKLEKNGEILSKYLKEQGIELSTVDFSPISTSLNYHRNHQGHILNTIESYELSQTFSIASQNISLITKVSQNITILIKEGLSIQSSHPQYFYSKINELKINMLGEAAHDALQRAKELVCKSGAQVGTLRSAQQGIFQITPQFSPSVSDYGEFDTTDRKSVV